MILDQVSLSVATMLVVTVAGITFVIETILRRDSGAGRIWTLAFLAAMLTSVAYLFWAIDPAAWWAIAVGNGAFVAGTGCMWLGARRFNERRMPWTTGLVGFAVAATVVASLIQAPSGGDWAGALPMFLSLMVFAALGCVECLRGEMGTQRSAWALSAVLGLQAAYYVGRIAVFISAGPASDVFTMWFGTAMTSLLTIVLTIVAVVVTSVLRASRSDLRGARSAPSPDHGTGAVLSADAMTRQLADRVERASWHDDLVGVIATRIDDLDAITTAFGREVATSLEDAWRQGVRRYAPSSAVIGEDGRGGLLVCVQPASIAEAKREADAVYRGLSEEVAEASAGVIPVVGVGVALSDVVGYDAATLERVAQDAAHRAAEHMESSVLVGEG